MTQEEIKKAFIQAKTDKHQSHGYDFGYSEIFKDFVPDSILEIGIKKGNSLAAWRMLFPNCQITGVDITSENFDEELLKIASSKIIISDATKRSLLKELDSEYDVIIDDGSHYYEDIIKTFDLLCDRFRKYYIIEDSLYYQNETVDYIKSQGFKVKMIPSKQGKVSINTETIEKYIKTDYDVGVVELQMIIVTH